MDEPNKKENAVDALRKAIVYKNHFDELEDLRNRLKPEAMREAENLTEEQKKAIEDFAEMTTPLALLFKEIYIEQGEKLFIPLIGQHLSSLVFSSTLDVDISLNLLEKIYEKAKESLTLLDKTLNK